MGWHNIVIEQFYYINEPLKSWMMSRQRCTQDIPFVWNNEWTAKLIIKIVGLGQTRKIEGS